ncbi:MAG: M48 family metallopeptidase [Deltaproteobacteria bacterium]|nr:M48 family metallopeptidase [Deltaproteobacteria bacterium]
MRQLLAAFVMVVTILFLLAVQGCQTVGTVAGLGADIAAATGKISAKEAESIKRGAQAAGQAFEEFTPENEYYIGRTIAANILSRYKAYENNRANYYVNLVGQTLAMASDKPETFSGYHFLILDSDEINAFAAPGGLILVTRGLIRCCRDEDALAAVLAHEIGHVQLGHGMGAIRGARYTSLGKVVGVELAKNLGGGQLAQVAEIFDGTVGDIMKQLVDTGYQSSQEYAADQAAVVIMKRVGYNPSALKDMLEEMGKRLGPKSGGFGKTHPSPANRLQKVGSSLAGSGPTVAAGIRKARFEQAMTGI